jgi:hypothetical protein
MVIISVMGYPKYTSTAFGFQSDLRAGRELAQKQKPALATPAFARFHVTTHPNL